MDTQNIPRIAASLDEELLSTRPCTRAHNLTKQCTTTTMRQTDKKQVQRARKKTRECKTTPETYHPLVWLANKQRAAMLVNLNYNLPVAASA